MKTSSYISSLFLALMLFCSVGTADAFAQKGNKDGQNKMQAMKVAFFTAELDLSADEAQTFWPVYNEYTSKMRSLRKAGKESQSAENTVANKEAKVALEKEYLTRFKEVLPGDKVDKLFAAEKKWKQELLDAMKERQKEK